MNEPLAPGAGIGIVGGGQLGRMLAAVAVRMGYVPHVLAPEESPPAAAHAVRHVRAEFGDEGALTEFATTVDVVTFEFENVSSSALAAAAERGRVRPGVSVLHTTQNRAREKSFLAANDLPHVSNELVEDAEKLTAALERIGYPSVVKTAGFGYDGKGQSLVAAASDAGGLAAAASLAAAGPVVVERFLDLRLELSVVGARGADGRSAVYAPVVNKHMNHILDLSVTPQLLGKGEDPEQSGEDAGGDPYLSPRLPYDVVQRAQDLTRRVMSALDLVGLCCVEFFLARSGELLINEIAPRPHNSGHLSIEAAITSQFEQQLRAVCGLPLGSTELKSYAAMANLLGEMWPAGGAPHFAAALRHEAVSLHLYGKAVARPGRKMGHLTALAATPAAAADRVLAARQALTKP